MAQVYDDQMLFDRQPDPYDHDNRFSPSHLRSQSPEADVQGSVREPNQGSVIEPDREEDQWSMPDGSIRRAHCPKYPPRAH